MNNASKIKRRLTTQDIDIIYQVQGLVGRAIGDYRNDRSACRAELVISSLAQAHIKLINLVSRVDPYGERNR